MERLLVTILSFPSIPHTCADQKYPNRSCIIENKSYICRPIRLFPLQTLMKSFKNDTWKGYLREILQSHWIYQWAYLLIYK